MSYRVITRLVSGVALLLALSLAACGTLRPSAGQPIQPGGDPSPTLRPGSDSGTPGGAALNGCSIQQAPSGLPPANVTLTAKSAQGATITPGQDSSLHVTVALGQIVDVRLDATYRWSITSSPSPTVLVMSHLAGWYDAASRQCVWRFTAAGRGVAPLQLTGPMVCPPQTPCPALAALASYVITVE